ncbi:PREDICTED: ATP-binding cassette sub-family A member 13 isoform X2 [Dinoponera quadriceps]|uniref:ATP-binding cassette sub-family A member 13 isoform X2 n=1 Tax=Dinoponera quadriceps TaxID=609295 RepID=A0A6P3X9M6_DINQU|nr:PREDICTED: ATP-binding cassette sub-family A member 13 isoform X2 [Dinoponera quadriceps]
MDHSGGNSRASSFKCARTPVFIISAGRCRERRAVAKKREIRRSKGEGEGRRRSGQAEEEEGKPGQARFRLLISRADRNRRFPAHIEHTSRACADREFVLRCTIFEVRDVRESLRGPRNRSLIFVRLVLLRLYRGVAISARFDKADALGSTSHINFICGHEKGRSVSVVTSFVVQFTTVLAKMWVDQLGLLLWKNYIVRKRQPGILALVFLWPVAVFMLLYTLRDNVEPEYYPTCQFPARSMPQDGLLPFVQTYICSVGNPCDPLSEYEEMPSYKNATLGSLVVELQPMLNNMTIISAVETLPQSIQLLKSMAQILTKPEIKAFFDRGIFLGDLFNNHEQIKDLLKSQLPGAREGLVDGLFESSVKLIYLIQTFGSSNIEGVVCSAESLKKYLIVPKEEDYEEISNLLCNIDSKAIPDILENLTKHLDFSGLLEMVDRAMAKFRHYSFFQDLKRTTEVILDLKTTKKYAPKYLKLHEWLPKIILAFENVTFKEIDLGFINKAIVILDPVFMQEREWPIARGGLLKLNRLLKIVKEVLKYGKSNSTDDFFSVMDQIAGTISSFSSNSDKYENITKILDLSFLILQDGVKLTDKLLDRYVDKFELAAGVFDKLRSFFHENIMNSLTYIVSLMDNIVQITHHVAVLHEDTLRRLYVVSRNHQDLVQKILTNLDSNVYRTIIRSFSRLDFLERLTDDLRKAKPDEVFCQKNVTNEIFDNFIEFKDRSDKIVELLCSDSGKEYITDVYNSFEFDKFQTILAKTLSTLVLMAFKQLVRIENANLTSVVGHIKEFQTYLDVRKVQYLDWSVFQVSDDWEKTFEETRSQGRMDILAIHLSIAQMVGVRSISYATIKPDLDNIDILAEEILRNLQANPTNWIAEVNQHKTELIESFYLTVTDRQKTLQILTYSNFTRTYCTDQNPPALLNFPRESNATLLKKLVCYLSKSVQDSLEVNVTNVDIKMVAAHREREFNWTAFNEKIIEIYQYIDTAVNQEDQRYNSKRMEKLKRDFENSWTTDVTVRDAWEISVGSICKLFSIMESPVFGIQTKQRWKDVYGVAWVVSLIFDKIEKLVDDVQLNQNVANLTNVLQDMPQTEMLVGSFLRGLPRVILDVIDMITLRAVSLISVIDDYKLRERLWPCVLNESIGVAMQLRNESRDVVQEIERIACSPGNFIKEWTEQPIIAKVRKLLDHKENVEVSPFNWTTGYRKFRQVVKKLDDLINDAKEVVLAEEPNMKKYIKIVVSEADKIVDERLPEMKTDWKNTLDHIDLEIDKTVKAFGSELSASNIWKPEVDDTDRILILLKYVSNFIHKGVRIVTNVLNKGTGKINLLSLLGFDNTTPVAIFHDKLPYILSTLLNGISDPKIERKFISSLENHTRITCSMMFEWLSDTRVGLSEAEYKTLKNFTCDLNPENFNVYIDFYADEIMTWMNPVKTYRSHIVSMIGDLYNLAKVIGLTMKNNIVIEPPFPKQYLDDMLLKLRDTLEVQQTRGILDKELKLGQEWSDYKLLIEGVSEALMHINDALKNAKIRNHRIETWELMENGDTRQMLKILEAHPEETIALVAILNTYNRTTGKLRPFKDIRRDMCINHFGSDYWNEQHRLHFLHEVCSFDPYQLLKSITSDEYHDVITGRTTVLQRLTPLTMSLSKLLDTVWNITRTSPELSLKSNILNVTTWQNLSNDTWDLILKSEKSWIDVYFFFHKYYMISHVFSKVDVGRLFQNLESVIELVSGGDIWQKLRIMYESSKIKPLLNLIEDMPNLLITAAETFVSSERLDDFLQKLLLGQLHPCDIDRYLIPPNYIRRKDLLSSITNFCQKIVLSDKDLTWMNILPFFEKYHYENSTLNMSNWEIFKRAYEMQWLYGFQTTLIRALSEGYKQPKIPTWWTSFEEGTYKDFVAQYKRKDIKVLADSMVKKTVLLLKNILKTYFNTKDCTWCVTLPMEILNSQLSQYNLYPDFLCQLNRLNISQIDNSLTNNINWNKTTQMVKDYKHLKKNKTLDEFLDTLETTLHYVANIIINFQNETYHETVTGCFNKFIGKPMFSRPGLYVMLMLSLLDMLENNVFLLDSLAYHEDINELTRLAEEHVSIWMPLRDVVKRSDLADVDALLPNATINVNAVLSKLNTTLCRTKSDCRNATILYNFLISKKAGKVLRYDPKAAKYPSVADISNRLALSLDVDLINRQRPFWRSQASWDLTWLKEILHHLSTILGESGNLLDVASKIDFEDVSNVLGVPDLADGIISILNDKTVDKLFDGMNDLLEDVEPLVQDQEVIDDLRRMVVALESMEIFKNLGLLDMKYVVRKMFDNWDMVRSFLRDRINVNNEILLTLAEAKIDMISVFMRERGVISLKDTICSPEKLGDMLYFNNSLVTVDEVSSALCQLNDSQTQNITITLLKNLNFDYIFKNLMNANVKNILTNANLTEAEGKVVLDNLGVASELFPFFKDKLTASLPSAKQMDESNDEETGETMSNSQFLNDASALLCGKKLMSKNGQIYKIISSLEDSNKAYDQKELNSLPNDFCRQTYKDVLTIPAGKIIWSYVKPLLRGQILYAPNTTVINEVMTLANETFVQMEHFRVLINSFEKTLKSLANLSEMGDSLKELQSILASDVMKVAVKSMGSGNFEGDFSDLNLSEIAWRLKKSEKMISMVGMLNDMMGCVLVNRTIGFSTEEELEAAASRLTNTNEFLAAVIFLDDSSPRSKRSLDLELPDNITYKIRMDVDYVPSTTRLKNQFWIPGPESSFLEHLRYLRGFIQLQDSVDRAIIKVKTRRDLSWRTLTQQMPYPCWKFAPFQSTLYESQGLQVCFFFALMICVGAAVRHIVWERESQNAMVMSVMGLKPWRNTLAWFITSFIELTIVMLSIATILLAGKILPRANPLLILVLLFDYIFSIVTFCYMISTMFSSASLAAVTTVVMFLLTYMPYVIVIAMEAVFGLGYKLLICLSMSTSFCYGCLYAVRKEVQGTGISWGNIWEESSPGDPMSLGLVLLTLAFDGCLYAVIGYLISRYTNSGRCFHGLRSRSLWWANTRSLYGRPSYLAFVNNLYFTNDVLHPSAAYSEDESDISSLTVTEKQIGVKFDGVKKVYHTEQGDVIAVDDFTLKLCEGEVTSLLGRNGAGKTTIIKMLTGMVSPTDGEICLNGEEGCKPDIGVCPQDNVLIGTLTPKEHMIFYWKLKRPADNIDMQRNVDEMLASLELGRQELEPVARLSGGTRRRLCVALAFLGSPRLVILDEPGAGVDPAARRRIWRLIDQHRIGRTVILSTHHLDEADMLSDTVVVMHKGKILCTGSPLSLKMMHGRGYRMNVSFSPDQRLDMNDKKHLKDLRTIVEEIVPNATINEVSESELIVTLPFQGKNGMNNDIAQTAKALEDNRKLLGFSHFSLECDTLERVFLDLCARADSGSSAIRASQDSVATIESHAEISAPDDDVDLITSEMLSKPSPFRQMRAIIKKRLWHFARDWRAPLAALVLPTMFVAVAMGFSLIRPPSEDEPPLALTPKLYNIHPTYFYSIDGSNDPFLQHVSLQLHDRFGDDYAGAWQTLPNDTGTCECIDGQQSCRGVSKAVEGLLQTLPGRPTLDWIVSTHQEYIEKRYGGWSLSHYKEDPLFVVWYNNKGHHSMPAYLNALNEAIFRASGVQGHLTTLNHPLKLSSDQLNRTSLLQHVADVGVALVLLIAFSLVAAQGTKELVRERLSEEKRILYLAGVHPITYWTTVLIWDFIVFGCAICLAVIVFEIFGLSAYVAKDNLLGVCLLLILFGWAAIPFSHVVEKAFDDSSLSNMVLFCVNTFIGVASLATILVLDIVGKTKTAEDVRNILHYILMIFPQYAFGDALVQISTNDITSELLQRFHMDTYQSPLGWDLLGIHYVFLVVIGGILFVLNLVIECRIFPNVRKQKISYEIAEEDEDVARERLRVEAGMVDDTLKTLKLRKEYRSVYGTNVAVQNLSFGVQAGKCFGLLGVNGAGKSTTFKMLTTEIIPTAGEIVLRGKEIGTGPLCNGEVGYCPQSDALDGFLTPHQCLTIHAEVCGFSNVPKAVESALKRFDLLKYAYRRVDSLSGGNRRKLCAAISVMAPVAVVLMDEPTSGMDPATKSLVARAVRQVTRNQGCVILTSHSVAECEDLCNQVGILARAGLRCIGTPQHLKHKFGEGYVAFLRFSQPVSAADLRRAILKYLPQAMISSRQATAARLLLPRSQDMALSVSFNMLKLLAEELKATDYTLTQSSLDQVLVNFSEELDDEAGDVAVFGQPSRNSMPNMYTSMDTIHMDTF